MRIKCKVDDCDNVVYLKKSGLCQRHHRRLEKYGNPLSEFRLAGRNDNIECSIGTCNKPAKTRTWCSGHYHRFQRYGDPLGEPDTKPPQPKKKCSIKTCDAIAVCRSWCQAHYVRWRTYGDVRAEMPLIKGQQPLGNPKRYRRIYKPNHPLAKSSGSIAFHRFVLYEEIGPGWHNCFWCGNLVNWIFTQKREEWHQALVVDHLDFDRDNNELDNLVPSCNLCNSHRWKVKEVMQSG